MISPEDVAAARQRASAHLQLRIEKVEIGTEQPGHCWLSGSIQSLWRDRSGGLSVGMRIRLQVDSRRRNQRCPPGDDLRLRTDQLRPRATIEAYADPVMSDAEQPSYQVIMGQAELNSSARPTASAPPSQATCCLRPTWQLERDLGHALGLDVVLGRCSHCGSRSVHLHCIPAASGSYIQPQPRDLQQMLKLPRGPEMKAFLKRWIDALF